jgi:hypothetical protein
VAGQRRRRRVLLADLIYFWLACSTKRNADKEGSATKPNMSGDVRMDSMTRNLSVCNALTCTLLPAVLDGEGRWVGGGY